MKFLITGGCRSGKSRRAQALAEELGDERFYLATAEPLDTEMEDRIRQHRADRGPSWHTIEEPDAIERHLRQPGPVVIDCLTLWVTNLMVRHGTEVDLSDRFGALAEAVMATPNPVILVTNEVGLGIVPMNAMARRFRDNAGWLAQRIARDVDHVEWMVAGLPVRIK